MARYASLNVRDLAAEETLRAKSISLGGDPRNESVDSDTGKKLVDGVTFTIGTEAANVINVAMQLLAGGVALGRSAVVDVYLSDDADGIGISGTAPATSVAIGTDGSIIFTKTAKLAFEVDSEVDGDIDMDITETGGDTWYMVVVANGIKYVSDAITFVS